MKSIQVCYKVKNDLETESKNVLSDENMSISDNGTQIEFDRKLYSYQKVYDEIATQESLYQTSCKPIIDHCFNGYNGCIFVYGCSGSGKTYTMLGPEQAVSTFCKKDFIESSKTLFVYL